MNVQIHDATLVSQVGNGVLIGKAFAFLSAETFTRPGYTWIDQLRATPGHAEIVSLLGRSATHLPGARVGPMDLGRATLAVVTCDKSLYREKHDTVHLFVVDPSSAGADLMAAIKSQGQVVRRVPARLNAQGAALLRVQDLPCGDYEVTVSDDDPACTFTVAEYRLAPLVAALTDRHATGDDLSVVLQLTTFGIPVDGDVSLELTDRGRHLQQVTAPAVAGRVQATFKLSGDGPHAINLSLVSDAVKTATVPIVGSRSTERSMTTFSKLGNAVSGSLLPGEDTIEVRGLFLQDGATSNSPFRLEKVDTRRARLTIVSAVQSAMVVVVDPGFPQGAPTTSPHPTQTDETYRKGEALFGAGGVAEARDLFLEGRPWRERAHPYWAYYIACCFAREGAVDEALKWLRLALRDGYDEYGHMTTDSDLAVLHGRREFDVLGQGGRTTIRRSNLQPGDVWEVEVPGPAAVLCIGAWIGNQAWEGWAATIAPCVMQPSITVPDKIEPGQDIDVTVETGDIASVYLLVKDARLLSADTPTSRLAGQIKGFVDSLNQRLAYGPATDTLTSLAPPPSPPRYGEAMPPPPTFSGPRLSAVLSETLVPVWDAPVAPAAPVARSMAAPPASRPPLVRKAAMGAPAQPLSLGSVGRPLVKHSFGEGKNSVLMGPISEAVTAAPSSPVRTTAEEPEVVFAGLVEPVDGKATARVRLGPDFADYVVEAFVLSNGDWSPVERRFTATQDVYVSLLVPPYVALGDVALGRVTAGAHGRTMQIEVTRDGEAVKLLDGQTTAAVVETGASHVELKFLARPGLYKASVRADGQRVDTREDRGAARQTSSIRAPLVLLEPGQALSRSGRPDIHGLKVLPGVDKPFRALVASTARYDHLCCEQTAARLMAAAVEYLMADTPADKGVAESSILAGITREVSMYLPGKGFTMYPGRGNTPDHHYGPQTAHHLRYLALLKDQQDLSPALRSAIDTALAMAEDATRAYGLEWPVRRPGTCQEAYMAVRFGGGGGAAAEVALRYVAQNGVQGRAEAAYAAATLLRLKVERARALELANSVYKHLGPNGNLHSTLDSVAAIALTAELRTLGIVGPGQANINGRTMSTFEAVELADEVREVAAVQGVVAVEVLQVVEENWSLFQSAVPLLVALEKGGRATRRCTVGDALDLHVQLESGYQSGDLLWVCLPDALTRVTGGGQVKRFSVDFEGQNEVRIPLAATEATVSLDGSPGTQHFMVCVRNMFDENRGGNPGPLDVTVAAAANTASPAQAVALLR